MTFHRFLIAFFFLLLAPLPLRADCVVLLHGLARSENSFALLEQILTSRGYTTSRPGYPSTKLPVEELAARTLPQAVVECDGAAKIHFVTHSMGGILLRQWLSLPENNIPNIGHTVMLGPPNQGSEVVDKFGDWKVFGTINGPAGGQLGTGADSLPSSLPAVDFPLGVIAGLKSLNPLFSKIIPGPDDGKVSVASTHVEGMRDHLILSVTHTFMMNDPEVIAQTLHFLQKGRFDPQMTWMQAFEDLIKGQCIGEGCTAGAHLEQREKSE
ncbi:lipase, putative [Roseobacter sp. SK209-2-6]|uniref:alpha/beta fold hydrolase n=1 Tax=Roseobacter sp. SK209-2-6 TaxID=388739 RepID=UPI0000F3D655|nr:alpha/beta fold hydrolase [Roseobacter sp. SK209-2-6]EBA15819.1 lipase, putative [Roseobacter sp. SK209-2-6]